MTSVSEHMFEIICNYELETLDFGLETLEIGFVDHVFSACNILLTGHMIHVC